MPNSRRSVLLTNVDVRQPSQGAPIASRDERPVGQFRFGFNNTVGGGSPSLFLNDDDAPPGFHFSELNVAVRVSRATPPCYQDHAYRLSLAFLDPDQPAQAVVEVVPRRQLRLTLHSGDLDRNQLQPTIAQP